MQVINFCPIGLIDYRHALELQKQLVLVRQQNQINDTCLLLEHPPVLTLGTRGHEENIYLTPGQLAAEGIAIHYIDRGGDVTYHGPGQLVAYPIFSLKDIEGGIRQFVANLQLAIIRMLAADYGIAAQAMSGKMTGVWVGERKIAAIGLSVKQGVSMHGFAFNINTNLDHFRWINPCGLSRDVTSIARELGRTVDMQKAYARMAFWLSDAFGRSGETITLDDLAKYS